MDLDTLDDTWEWEHFSELNTADETTDSDGDGLLDRYELLSGTDPAETNSCIGIVSFEHVPGGHDWMLSWYSISNREYKVLSSQALSGSPWNVDTNVYESFPLSSHIIPASPTTSLFLRVDMGK